MIHRTCIQKITWLDVENGIMNESTTIEWRLFGKILLRRRVVDAQHTLPEGHKNSKIGFGS